MTFLADRIRAWICDSVKESDAAGVVLEIDGTLDSAVVAILARQAVGDRATGLLLPCSSEPTREDAARRAAQAASLITTTVRLETPFQALRATLPEATDRTLDNLKARLRTSVLFFFADHLNYLAAGSRDRNSLLASGLTQCEEAGADLMPIGGLFRDDVIKLSQELGLPECLAATDAGTGSHNDGFAEAGFERILLSMDDSRSKVDPAATRQLKERVRRSARTWIGPRICDVST
jgi:NAD+ synthase